MPRGIFISYRRDDAAGFAGRLYDGLVSRYGPERIFMDIDTIRPGHDFASDIASALSDSLACIVLIGRRWESTTQPDGRRRLEDPTDFVRLEVAAAIRRGVIVIPVLVEGASPPSPESLPQDLRALAGRQAIELSNERWNYDVGRLLLSLDEVMGKPGDALQTKPRRGGPRKGEPRKGEPRRRVAGMPALIAGTAVVLSLVGVLGWLALRGPDPTISTGPTNQPSVADPTESTGPPGSGDCPAAPLPPSSGGRLDGTYLVTVTLKCRVGDLGNNLLWGEKDPMPDVAIEHWESREWTFSSVGPDSRWVYGTRNVDAMIYRQNDGTYVGTDRHSPTPTCSIPSLGERPRRLRLSVSGQPDATGFEGSLLISFKCQGRFVARFEVTGTRIG